MAFQQNLYKFSWASVVLSGSAEAFCCKQRSRICLNHQQGSVSFSVSFWFIVGKEVCVWVAGFFGYFSYHELGNVWVFLP